MDAATIKRFGDSPLLIFADHASNTVPAENRSLGLTQAQLATHIAWDSGAAATAQKIGKALAATVVCCGYSRLLVDPNRDPNCEDVIPQSSDGVEIPGNQRLSKEERHLRVQRFHAPYHQTLSSLTAEITPTLIVSIHSFTPQLQADKFRRPWDVGLLWHHDKNMAMRSINWLQKNTAWTVGDNQPYDGRHYNYTADRLFNAHAVAHITVEIRQDNIDSAAGIEKCSATLTSMIAHLNNQAVN